MLVSLEWLSDFIDLGDRSPAELADTLTALGLEAVVAGEAFSCDGVVVGEVLEVAPHPNAERLSVCTVSIGGDSPLTIVCGAPNVADGQKVAVAPVGTTLPGGLKIKRAKIRKVESEGMICAEDELGLGDDHEGIVVLPEDAPIGAPLASYLHLAGERVKLDLTPNRPDALSHLGVARDLGAHFDLPISAPDARDLSEDGPPVADLASVEIADAEGCPRYVARVIEGVTIAQSPPWLAGRLRQVGIRPINNVVDATNYALYALGHPLHAFDLDRLSDRRIVVRAAEDGESFTTLDGVERRVAAGSVMICDAEAPVALGGVMGGENSEISESTTNVLLEAAYFDPSGIRRASRAVGLQTDASYRFERGADWDMVERAIDFAASLIHQTAGGKVAAGRIDEFPRAVGVAEVPLRWERIPRILGVDVPRDEARRILPALGMQAVSDGDDAIVVRQPSWRPDLTREIDLIEEVARIWGYDRVPSHDRIVTIPQPPRSPEWSLAARSRELLTGMGLQEAVTTTLVSEKQVDSVPTSGAAVELANYSTAEMSRLRTHMLPSLLEVARLNTHRRSGSGVALFEIGDTFARQGDGDYRQDRRIVVLLAGDPAGSRWCDTRRQWDYYDLRGIVEALVWRCSLRPANIVHYDQSEYAPPTGARILIADDEVGCMGQVGSDICDRYDLTVPVFYSQLDLAGLAAHRRELSRVEPLPRHPATERDLALTVSDTIPAERVQGLVKEAGGATLESVVLFDVYRGEGLGEGERSLAFGLKFRSSERTLTDREVDKQVDRIVRAAAEKAGAQLRK